MSNQHQTPVPCFNYFLFDMASSSSTSTTKLGRKHHVFLSFRGEDTRVGFTSHLNAALERKNILTFIDDDLKRGDEISDSLVKAIEGSKLSVIIFSQLYASSKWCLDELVKILESRKLRGQIVIPIFYQVDPSDVRKQSGSFEEAFAELVQSKALGMEEERCYRAALKEAANISGHDSRKFGSESKFVEKIVKEIFNKLCKMFPIHTMNLVGTDKRIREIESLLKMGSQDVRIVGIWGMGGIGKTTIAGAVYNKICSEFEAFVFVPNIREELERRTVVDLQRSFVSILLDQEISDMGPLSFGNHFIKDGLRLKKVLIVFDDVDSSMPLQGLLLEGHNSFGPGSRILVASRDKHVLDGVVDETYRVEALNNIEAIQLLKSKAFKKIDPTSDYKDLLGRIVNYAKGNPLALVVLGSSLFDRSIEDWHSAMNGLGQIQNVEILNVLKISYDGLYKEQKEIFLNIALLFRGMDRDKVTKLLEKKSSSMRYYISILIERSLVTSTLDNRLGMHDLLQAMACSIVSKESENPRKRSRLVDPEDIYRVLKKRKGTKAVKGIYLDMPESMDMQLKSDAFAGMRCLEFLIIKGNRSKVQLPRRGLDYISKKLIYFRWDGYPSRSLPQKFCAENLVEFDFSWSKLEKLWSGQQNLVNLRRINLSYSPCLTKLPDLSKASQLQVVNFNGCHRLIEVPSYFQHFENLEHLCLGDCDSLQCFPRRIDSNNIKTLRLGNFSSFKKLPQVSAGIKLLYLEGSAIEEIQQSFGDESAELYLYDCSNITKFPEISGNLNNLSLTGSSIEEVPSSIQFLTNLQELDMTNCKKLSRLPSSICKLKSLEILYLSGCSKLESFPEIMEPMESLKQLGLRGTAIKELPSSIRNLKSLHWLCLDGTLIKELQELPPSLNSLAANGCESLEIISTSTLGDSGRQLSCANCFKLDQKALMADMQLKIQFGNIRNSFQMVLPGSEIPEWFCDHSMGSSTTIQFPSNPLKLKAIALCFVFDCSYTPFHPSFFWRAKIKNGEHNDVICRKRYPWIYFEAMPRLDHMYLCYDNCCSGDFSKYSGHEVTVEFHIGELGSNIEGKRCGIHLVFDENPDQPNI